MCIRDRYDAVSRDGSDFVLEEPVQENLRLVQGAAIGKQQIYGLVSNLELYSRNVPYEDTQWACLLYTSLQETD